MRKAQRALYQVEVQNLRGWRLLAVLLGLSLPFVLLGGALLGLRRSLKWSYQLPRIVRVVGIGVAVCGTLLLWVFTDNLAKDIAHEERFISWSYAFYAGQLGILLGGVGGYLAGTRPSVVEPPHVPGSDIE